MRKKRARQAVDCCMTALLPMLMAYSLIGERFHEMTGTAMLALFIAHHVLNRGWYQAAVKGKYTSRRIFQTVLNAILLVCMILQPVSGILMSKHLYTFIQAEGISSTVREIHICIAYWGFVLMCIHAGAHLSAPLGRLRRRKQPVWRAAMVLLIALSLYGCRAFAKRQLAEYMFRRTIFAFFDYAEPRVFFFLDYMAVMVLFAFIGYLIITSLTRKNAGKSHRACRAHEQGSAPVQSESIQP